MIPTGRVTSWSTDPTTIGPLYPFVGSELWLFLLCIAFCIAFTLWKLYVEQHGYRHKVQQLRQAGKLAEAMGTDTDADAS